MDSKSPAPTVFGLFRHGQTVWNREKRLQGRLDSPLTDEGKSTLHKWAKQLRDQNWQRIIASDLGRVQETVAALDLPLPTRFDSKLREQDWGDWEGLTLAEVRRDHGNYLASQTEAGWDFRPPGGESRREVRDRVIDCLESIYQCHPAERILLICHLSVIKCFIYHISGRKFLPGEPKLLKKACMHEIIRTPAGLQLGRINIHPPTVGSL